MLQTKTKSSDKCKTRIRYKFCCWFQIGKLHSRYFMLPSYDSVQILHPDHKIRKLLTLENKAEWLLWFLLHSWNRKASIKQDLFLRDILLPQLSKHFSKQKLSKSSKTCCIYLHSILTASTCSSFNQRVPHINDPADPICIGMELSFKGLVFLVFALNMTKAKLLETGQRAPKLFSWVERRAQELSTCIKRSVYSLI